MRYPASKLQLSVFTWHADTQKFWSDAGKEGTHTFGVALIPGGIFTFDGFPAADLGKEGQRERGMRSMIAC